MSRWLLIPLVFLTFVTTAHGQYFPKLSLGSSAGDQLKVQWYSSMLQGLQEPTLLSSTKDPEAEAYRFLWLRSFHHPIAVRLTLFPDGTGVLTTKVASGAGGFHPGTVIENTSRALNKEQTRKFLFLLEQVHFWSLPNPVSDQTGTDGSQWIIEGVKGGQYHVADRWSPKTGPVRELGEMLAFQLAGLSVPDREIY